MSTLWTDHVSFSQLQQVEECPYGEFLLKAMGIKPVPNAFAEAGSLAHKLLACWAKGELKIRDLPVQWVEQFTKSVTTEFPSFLVSKGYAVKLFDNILNYFEHFDGFPGYEVIEAEKEFSSMIAGERFEGIIDLILRNKATGEITIVDFKSCSLASFKKNRDQMYRQLLLYAKYCNDLFGCPPSKLRFELIKENTFDERDYNPEEYIGARIWAETIIKEMKVKDIADWLEVRPELFRCTNLCNCRNECKFGRPENHKRKDDIIGTKRVTTVA